MNVVFILFFSSLASFVGSLQLGPVNVFVIDTALNINKKSAYFVALGGILPEFIYCGLAVYFGNLFLIRPTLLIIFKCAMITVLIVIGCMYLFKKQKANPVFSDNTLVEEKSQFKNSVKGFSLAILNPQLLPYWLFVMVYFNSIYFLKITSISHQIAYILGAGIGAFALLASIITTINTYKMQLLKLINNKYYYKALAIVFFGIALQQLSSLL